MRFYFTMGKLARSLVAAAFIAGGLAAVSGHHDVASVYACGTQSIASSSIVSNGYVVGFVDLWENTCNANRLHAETVYTGGGNASLYAAVYYNSQYVSAQTCFCSVVNSSPDVLPNYTYYQGYGSIGSAHAWTPAVFVIP